MYNYFVQNRHNAKRMKFSLSLSIKTTFMVDNCVHVDSNKRVVQNVKWLICICNTDLVCRFCKYVTSINSPISRDYKI